MIKLYETYHAGGISKIMAKNPAGHWVTLYTAPKLEIINSSRVFSPNLTVKMTIHDTDSKWSMKSCFWDHLIGFFNCREIDWKFLFLQNFLPLYWQFYLVHQIKKDATLYIQICCYSICISYGCMHCYWLVIF